MINQCLLGEYMNENSISCKNCNSDDYVFKAQITRSSEIYSVLNSVIPRKDKTKKQPMWAGDTAVVGDQTQFCMSFP